MFSKYHRLSTLVSSSPLVDIRLVLSRKETKEVPHPFSVKNCTYHLKTIRIIKFMLYVFYRN